MENRFAPVLWLQEANFKAYLVGNQSRNAILGATFENQDIDIATSALPKETERILLDHGLVPIRVDNKFGVVGFVWQNIDYEITTFRQDIYDPQFNHIRRTPIDIIFHKDPAKDALRRDFTMNSIYWNPKTNHFTDPVQGKKDLEDKILKFIGEPEIRIKEDPIRVLRAIRFKHSLGLKYHPATWRALIRQGRLVHKLQPSVLKKEFTKIQNLSIKGYQAAKEDMRKMGIVWRV